MPLYVLSPRARTDLDDIWSYTAENWGTDQAERYIRILQQSIETVALDPRRGRSCDEIRPGYRRYSVASHVLFFRMAGDQVDIVRILHQGMDSIGTSDCRRYRVVTR